MILETATGHYLTPCSQNAEKRFLIIFFLFLALQVFSFFGFAGPASSAAASLIQTYFTEQEKEEVLNGGIITTAYLKNHKIVSTRPYSVKPEIPKTQYIKDSNYASYEMMAVEKAFIPFRLTNEAFRDSYNILTQYSSLSGVNYYSRTESKYLPFIKDSYRIRSPDDHKPVKDIAYNRIPAKQICYFEIEDNRFGKLTFESRVYVEGNNILVRNVSLQPMTKLLFKINEAGEYELNHFFLYDPDAAGFFYYAFHAMRIRSDFFLGLSNLTPENFADRIRAVTVHMVGYFGHDWSDRIRSFQ